MEIQNTALAFGTVMGMIGLIFYTSELEKFRKFYAIVPAIVLCCFVPAGLNTAGLFDTQTSRDIYGFAARYLLPSALFLMTISMDFKRLIALGWKVLAMFLSASIAIIFSGVITLYLYKSLNPEAFADGSLWRGFTTLAGAWIGGAVNQTAMKELFNVDNALFAQFLMVDAINASIWLLIIFFLAKHSEKIDNFLKADNQNIKQVIEAVSKYEENSKITTLRDFLMLFGLTFFVGGIADFSGAKIADFFSAFAWAEKFSLSNKFFWVVVVITLIGTILSLTPIRKLDYIGASKLGTVCVYILIASIGMQIQLRDALSHWELIAVGLFWMLLHILIIFIVAKIIKAPIFYLCVGSNANTGGASSAPIVATAFHPSLAPVGVLLGIFGYILGTVGGYIFSVLIRVLLGLS